MDDFASTALFNLIAVELRKQGMDVSVNAQFDGKTSGSAKRELLAVAMTTLGPSAVVRIGQGIRDIPFHPVLAVLKKARHPSDLLQRWQRLEGYYHGHHRVEQLDSTPNSFTLRHYSEKGETPTPGEDLLIAGFLAALLGEIGLTGLVVTVDGTTVINDDRVIDGCENPADTSQWQFTWSGHPLNLTVSAPLTQQTKDAEVVQRVKRLIQEDPARGWTVSEMANELQTSNRTLQRRLSAAGASFQMLLRELRVECAASDLLQANANRRTLSGTDRGTDRGIYSGIYSGKDSGIKSGTDSGAENHVDNDTEADVQSNVNLAQTGYACGFSDQAHFSREFKKRYNIAPSEYLQLASAVPPE